MHKAQSLLPKHFVLADWGDGKKWVVSSAEFDVTSNESSSSKEVGFKQVKMTLGDKEITSGHMLRSPTSWMDHILVKLDRQVGFWILEDGSRHSSFELRRSDKFNDLKVNKYNSKPFQDKWQKVRGIIDYDVNFESCKFTQEKPNTITSTDKISLWRVDCGIDSGPSWHKITRQLTEDDYLSNKDI